jgi:phage terminase large subunit
VRKLFALALLALALAAPAESAVHVEFKTLPAWMNDKFYASCWDRNRFNVWIGGAGSGKSVGAAQRYVYRLTAESGHNLLVIRKVGVSHRYSTFASLVYWIYTWHLDSLYEINDSTMHIRNKLNGNEVIFRGMNDFRARERAKSVTFKSGPLTDIWIEEASELETEDFEQLNLRLRGTAPQPFQMTLTFNPINVDHWLKVKFFDNPRESATIIHSTYLDNRFIDDDYRAQFDALKITDPIMYDVYALGKWGQLGEKAFTNIVFENCRYAVADFDKVLYGQDFGFNHYNAIEGLGLKDGEIYSFSELYVRQKTNAEIIQANEREHVLAHDQRCRADSAEPKSITEWTSSGYCIEPAKKGPDSVQAQFGYLRAHRWHIDPEKCPGLAAEVRGANYKKDRNGKLTEEIVSFHDDALAACRYAIEEELTPGAWAW